MKHRPSLTTGLLSLLLLLAGALGTPAPSAPVTRRTAVIVGISRYDEGTRLPDLPQCEVAARELHVQVSRLPGLQASDVRLLSRRVTRDEVLGAVRKAVQDAGKDGGVLVAISCAGSEEGLHASNGVIAERDLRSALSAATCRSVLLLLDAGDTGDMAPEPDVPLWATLTSCEAGQQPWPLFLPDPDRHNALSFVSAAPAGWARALEKTQQGRRGDLGSKNQVSAEDLQLAADPLVAVAVRRDDTTRRMIDPDTGGRFLDSVSPQMVQLLNRGQTISMQDLRDRWGSENFSIFADDLWSISSYGFRQQPASTRKRILDGAHGAYGSQALRALQRELQERGLLISPPAGLADDWKRLEARRSGHFALVLPARQESRLRGNRALSVYGRAQDCSYPMAYGTWSGELQDTPRLRLELQIWGTWATGTWEGSLDGGQARGDWQGTYNALSRRIEGRIEGTVRNGSRETPLAGMFEGTLSTDGQAVSGTWKSATSPLPRKAQWKLRK